MPFPNFKRKHANDSMFSPEDFLDYQRRNGKHPGGKLPKSVILCYNSKLMQSILETQPIHPLAVFHLHNDFFVLQKTKGKVGIIGNFGIGAPVAAIMVEELAAFGVKKFIS